MKNKFTINDWNHMHDCVLDVTWHTTKKNLSDKELEELFDKLPDNLKYEAYEWGMSDTLWRDNFIEWLQENKIY